ncbi:hypothetical protein [Geodermatophilus ruber]|uniref:Uncharacterized protein n=1 Tax=Geodermatophilus ruber TaxID=504800 RepID=A0A1I3Z3D5_9ACTN|nr:hypothetical protein [Geodermatophilus ruber]SFK38547.1 hypothetical protein SAMN04488085_101326 [Geodermatophilus ruber]
MTTTSPRRKGRARRRPEDRLRPVEPVRGQLPLPEPDPDIELQQQLPQQTSPEAAE